MHFMHTLWTNLIYNPIYNALVFIAQYLTWQDVGVAVIVLTILIRLILMPLSKKSIAGQYKMKLLEPKLAEIKAKGLSKEDEAKETFALYKDQKINPFSGCLYLLIQLPILFALYFTFMHGVIQPDHLYSFLSTDGLRNTLFGLIDITKPFLPLAILAGISQGVQAYFAPKPSIPADGKGFQAQFAQSLSVQTRYILPIIIILIASRLAAAVALYWTITNVFSIIQEKHIRKKFATTLV